MTSDGSGALDGESCSSVSLINPTERRSAGDDGSLNNLRFSSLGIHGRDEEVSRLKKAYLRVRTGDVPLEMALVSGQSGVGKSAIVYELKDFIEKRNKRSQTTQAFFAGGKFDLQQRIQPYSAFVHVFTQLCDEILALEHTDGEEVFENLRDSIIREVGPEGMVLTGVMPDLRRILGDCDSDTDDEGDDLNMSVRSDFDGPRARNQFNFAMRCFARSVCSAARPLVMFVDDLQWADSASLELMDLLVTDRELHGLLFVGCYRSDEVDELTHPLAARIREIQQPDRELAILYIVLGNLSVDTTTDLIADLLACDSSHSQGLAALVHKKTLGNVFFLRQFITSLRDKGLLYYCFGTMRWRWNEDQIRSGTSVADNVASLMHEKMQSKLDARTREVLQIAACLGSTFDEGMLIMVDKHVQQCWGEVQELSDDHHQHKDYESGDRCTPTNDCESEGKVVVRCLGVCVCEGLLDKENESEYRFVHDQVQQAAGISHIPENKLDLLQLFIGQALVENLTHAQLKRVLFVAVDLLNTGIAGLSPSQKSLVDRASLARLNLLAGRRAMKKASAFVPAAKYLKAGINLLGPKHWEDEYELSINLFSTAAEAEYSCGNFEQVRKYVDQILAQSERPFLDKFRAYSTLLKAYGNEGKYLEVIDMSLDVLAQMGVHIPKSNLKIAFRAELMKTKHLLNGLQTNALIDLPLMEDEVKIKAMRLMDNLCTAAFFAMPDLFPLILFKLVRYSVRYGLCKNSTFAFAGYGIMLCSALDDHKEGYEFGKLAMAVLEKLDAKDQLDMESRTVVVTYLHVMHWALPVQSCLKPFLRGYEAGMQSGDIETAMYGITRYCNFAFISGRQLTLIEADMKAYCQQMKDYRQKSALSLAVVLWQLVLNLLGRSKNPTLLTGAAMDEEVTLKGAAETQNVSLRDYIKTHRMWLAFYFDDYELAQRLIDESKSLPKTNPGLYLTWRSAFFEGLTAFALAREGDHKIKWKSRARVVMKQMLKWVKNGNVNCVYMVSFFEAEMAALKGRNDLAKLAYDETISTCARNGFPQDGALANERAGEFFLDNGDTYWAAHYLGQAHRLYIEWEAHAKANHLHEKHADLLSEFSDKTAQYRMSRRLTERRHSR